MAIYDYQCNNCKVIKEISHGINEEPILECDCGSTDISKVILQAPACVVPPQHQAAGSKFSYYGIKNPITGEGIENLKEGWADGGQPGIRVKSSKS
jgi:putative FmdB family regulatory protein